MTNFKPLREVDLKILYEWFQEPTINQYTPAVNAGRSKTLKINIYPDL